MITPEDIGVTYDMIGGLAEVRKGKRELELEREKQRELEREKQREADRCTQIEGGSDVREADRCTQIEGGRGSERVTETEELMYKQEYIYAYIYIERERGKEAEKKG